MIVDGAALRDAIVRASAFVRAPQRTGPTVATEGVHVEYRDGYLDVIGTDGHTLVRTAIPVSHVLDAPVRLNCSTLPPETRKTLEGVAVGPVRVELTTSALRVEADGWPRWGMVPTEDYPDWRAVYDRVAGVRRTHAEVHSADFTAALKALEVAKIPKKTHDTAQPVLRVSLGATHHTNGVGVLLERIRPLSQVNCAPWEHLRASIRGDSSTASDTYQARYILRALAAVSSLKMPTFRISIPCDTSDMLPVMFRATSSRELVDVLVMPFILDGVRPR